MAGVALTLTPASLTGLFYVQRYRFLTIAQFARLAGLSRHHAEDLLHGFALRGIVGHFGHVTVPGHGKTPKVYHLRRKGWELLRSESDIPEELVGPFVEAHREASWSPQMYHRLRLLDLLVSLEVEVRGQPQLNLVRTFLEYRRTRRGGRIARETTDFVADEETPENRIIPDAAFVLENTWTGRRALFFLEIDRGTEVISDPDKGVLKALRFYAEYLLTAKYQRYAHDFSCSEFKGFRALFVTTSPVRVQNIRQALCEVTEGLRGEGVTRIALGVETSNDSALKLYERCGFERVGTDDYFLLDP